MSFANTNPSASEGATFREVRIGYNRKRYTATIKDARSAVSFLRSVLPNNVQEHVLALYLDGSHQPIGWAVITSGLANSCMVDAREVYQRAVGLGATAIILAHNHPSGSADPSLEDHSITTKLLEAGKVLGIKLLDHVVIGEHSHYSFQEAGRM